MTKAPSPQALRALYRLCQSSPTARTYSTSRATRPITNHSPRTQNLQSISSRSKTTLAAAPEPADFANDPTKYRAQARTNPEPPNQGTLDPQQAASAPHLPDITNYYTLFPVTLPHGPPHASSSSSLPSSADLAHGGQPQQSPSSDQNTSQAKFHINPRALRAEFLRLQSQHHPDKFPAGSPQHHQAYALSTLLNNAYRTLADPLLRAQYLLQLQYDVDVTTEDNTTYASDADTLMVVMEAQEALEELGVDTPRKEAEEIVDRLKEENGQRVFETERALGDALERGDKDVAIAESVRLKYWKSLEAGLSDWEPGKEVRLTH